MTAQYQELSPHPVPALVQIVGTEGELVRPPGQVALPVTEADRQVMAGQGDLVLYDSIVDGVPVRIASRRADDGRLLQVARAVTDVQATLNRLAVLLGLVRVMGGRRGPAGRPCRAQGRPRAGRAGGSGRGGGP